MYLLRFKIILFQFNKNINEWYKIYVLLVFVK